MKQILQNYKTGVLSIEDVPRPMCHAPHDVLVQNCVSLLSAGTERSMRDFAQKSLIQKAQARPDLFKKVLQKVRDEGVVNTFQKVRGRLDVLAPLGYSCSGIVLEVGEQVQGLRPGDRIACGGAGWANHAEIVSVPAHLCAKVADAVSFEDAAYTTLGSVALHGVRLAELALGETVVVIGLGILGQVVCQIARASGCRVVGIDLAADRIQLAKKLGAGLVIVPGEDSVASVLQYTDGLGADAVLITAAAQTNDPIELAAELCRDRGRIVVVGDVKMDLPRRPFYYKELAFRISRSYGPGRYDPSYESLGVDYPAGYVRWTEQRNFSAFLNLIAQGQIDVQALTTHRFAVSKAQEAYDLITGAERHTALGILLNYPNEKIKDGRITLGKGATPVRSQKNKIGIGVIGVGEFARGVILPRLKKTSGIHLKSVCSKSGVTARHVGDRFGFDYCTSNALEIVEDDDVSLVMVMTRHGSHARLVCETLRRDKDVFVEKPLAISEEELMQVYKAQERSSGRVFVGFNRRFAPAVETVRMHFANRGPLTVICRVNAGTLPEDHWIYSSDEGGRILGEVCHFIDLCSFLVRREPLRVQGMSMKGKRLDDNVGFTFDFSDGSVAQVLYTSVGSEQMPKERIEVFGGGASAVIEDFRELTIFDQKGKKRFRYPAQDKGHAAEIDALIKAHNGDDWPMDFESICQATLATIRAQIAARVGVAQDIDFDMMRKSS